ncbi:hypothetical protein SCACP_02020 [Sporomusa carbonis]|uniref:PadR family transcriptional regulator n=1 Tax=Sporomusa carbonis TaxID=3076075 RepID=UPI003A73781E
MIDIKKCPCMGINLDKLIQPAILTLLSAAELHGYIIVQKLQETCILQGKRPDPSGVYRCLRLMEQRGLVTAVWNVSDPGPARRLYTITDIGLECLRNWIHTLENYHRSLGNFLVSAKNAICSRD